MPMRMAGLLISAATAEGAESLRRRGRRRGYWRPRRREILNRLPTAVGRLAIDSEVISVLCLRLLGRRIGIGKRIVAAARRQIAGGGDDNPIAGKIDVERRIRCHSIEEEPATD